jgi:molecular chaperone DnaK (HSP70)
MAGKKAGGLAIGINLGTTYSCVAVWRPSHNRRLLKPFIAGHLQSKSGGAAYQSSSTSSNSTHHQQRYFYTSTTTSTRAIGVTYLNLFSDGCCTV